MVSVSSCVKTALPRGTAPFSPSHLSKQVQSILHPDWWVHSDAGTASEALLFPRVSLLKENQCCLGTSIPQDFSGWGQVWRLPGVLRVIHQRSADKSAGFWPILWLQMRPTVSLAQIRPLQEGRQWLGRLVCFVCSPF